MLAAQFRHHLARTIKWPRPAARVAALARGLGRDYKRVHADAAALTSSGLLHCKHGDIRTRFDELRAQSTEFYKNL